MSETATKVPAWYWIVAVVALIWNLLGVLGFAGTIMVMSSAEMQAALPPEMQAIYANVPVWSTIAYAVAVFGGVLGAIALLIKKAWATALFALSLIGIIISDIYSFAVARVQDVSGTGAFVMPAVVLIVAIFLVWFSMMAKKKGYTR